MGGAEHTHSGPIRLEPVNGKEVETPLVRVSPTHFLLPVLQLSFLLGSTAASWFWPRLVKSNKLPRAAIINASADD